MKIKTIDINCLEWFDRINGNSYFAGTVTTNFGTESSKQYILVFQYGYGDQFIESAHDLLIKKKVISNLTHDNDVRYPLWRYCRENKVILRSNIQRGCLKCELMQYTVEG